MDGFCWQGELDLTLFYKIEGYFDNLKSLMTLMTMTENDRNLWGLKMIMTLNDFERVFPPSLPSLLWSTMASPLSIFLVMAFFLSRWRQLFRPYPDDAEAFHAKHGEPPA